MFNPLYEAQANLLIECIPQVAKHECFALKGGTAINLFLRDLPRISVDLDLTYLPLRSRDESLQDIEKALTLIKTDIERYVVGTRIWERSIQGHVSKLSVARAGIEIKIEVNLVVRGSVRKPILRELSTAAQNQFGASARIQILAVEDIYGGKLCAALDRQHPRDLFDVSQLLAESGITPAIRRAFVVYLASHPRPMHELLNPNLVNINNAFEEQFAGMTRGSVTLNELLETRQRLVHLLPHSLDSSERRFLISMKEGEPEWDLLGIADIARMPALQWKLLNIRKMDAEKRVFALEKLHHFLNM
ncbi:MAG: nucleotidyl transferase AbiEii/AbiGii toxin family protein [Bacteroidales bacterium]|nr:nucleotidyl transferase AbiEii/AbiGii toxin family protein [Bacteroidales bacterium]